MFSFVLFAYFLSDPASFCAPSSPTPPTQTYTILGDEIHCNELGDGHHAVAGVLPRAIRSIFDRLNRLRHEQLCRDNDGAGPTTTADICDADDEEGERCGDQGDDCCTPASSDDGCDDDFDMDGNFSYQVKLQFLELYGEEIRDLLATHTMQTRVGGATMKLTIRDTTALTDEPEVVGASQMLVETAQEALEALQKGMVRRVTGATAMNQSSSRSHAILSVLMEQRQRKVTTTDQQSTSLVQVKRSKFNFVDLAGSERQKKTLAEGKRLKEGIDINKGLLVLGNVISALGDTRKRGSFVPYRDSKLTRLLKGSLGGNHKTLMIACVSPSSSNMEETLNCLRYANRAKNIQNRAVVNVDENSRLVSQLQRQVYALAGELLKAWDGDSTPEEGPLTRENVEAIVSGQTGSSALVLSSLTVSPSSSRVIAPSVNPVARLRETELELSRTRDMLQEARSNHDAAEKELYTAKAENQLFQLQMSVRSASNSDLCSTHESANPATRVPQDAFLERITHYESEIGKLKQSLRAAEAKSRQGNWLDGGLHEDDSIEQAKRALEKDRERLMRIQSSLDGNGEAQHIGELQSIEEASGIVRVESSQSLDQQDKAEEAQLSVLTKKYLGDADDYDEQEQLDSESVNRHADDESPTVERRQRHLQADLVELARNIAAKEDLIDQLQLSQEKYSSMRDFYEEKLKQMETTLSENEAEREQLLEQLKRSKESDEGKKLLQNRLQEKEDHIKVLRKKHAEITRLQSVSSQNHGEIARLQADVKNMKRRKVDLQKQLGQERKDHAFEKKRLEKTAIQKEREVDKWKKVSTQSEVQAQKAGQVAKARLEEIGHLRTKYKDAEKKLRLLSLKKGVMLNAGLDPVMIGRREAKQSGQKSGPASSRKVDADTMRDYFDQKVADVVRKEAIADKLAQEWEEHFELSTKKEELLEGGNVGSEDEVQSLSIQIQFKEDCIRQLAQRLGKHQIPQKTMPQRRKAEAFLFDKEFKDLCSGKDDWRFNVSIHFFVKYFFAHK